MGFRVVIPKNKPNIEFVLDTLLENPLKGFEINDPVLSRQIGHYANNLVDDGVLEILYNRKKKTTTLLLKADVGRKKNARYNGVEYILGDKLDNVLSIPKDALKIKF